MEVIRGVLAKTFYERQSFVKIGTLRLTLYTRAYRKFSPLSLVVFTGYKLNLLSKTSKQYC